MKPATEKAHAKIRERLEVERVLMRAAHEGLWAVWRRAWRKLRRMR